MKNTKHIFAALFMAYGLLSPAASHAANCNSAAQSFASQKGGEVLGVVANESGNRTVCEVTIRIPGKNGKPPRVVTKSIKL